MCEKQMREVDSHITLSQIKAYFIVTDMNSSIYSRDKVMFDILTIQYHSFKSTL